MTHTHGIEQMTLRTKTLLAGLAVGAAMLTLPAVSSAASLVVTSNADAGPGTLRQAILDANAGVGVDDITFSAGTSTCSFVIQPLSALPALTDAGTIIDGSGCSVVLDGSLAPAGTDGLRLRASDSEVYHLTIKNFDRDGLRIQPNGPGTQPAVTGVIVGKNIFKNNLDGLRVFGGDGPGNAVEANIIKNRFIKNRDDGIFVLGSSNLASSGGNKVHVNIEANQVVGSQGSATGGVLTGDGIRVIGGGGLSGHGAVGGNVIEAAIHHNQVSKNLDDGIVVAGTGQQAGSRHKIYTKIYENKVTQNGGTNSAAGNGIVIRGGTLGSSTTTTPGNKNRIEYAIVKNYVKGNRDDGIRISGGLGKRHDVSGDILENQVYKNGRQGIAVLGGGGIKNFLHDIAIKANRVGYNGNHGILITGSNTGVDALMDTILVSENKVGKNGAHGVAVLDNGTNNVIALVGILYNQLIKNVRDGLFVQVDGAGTTPIAKNKANRNGEDGIDINAVGYELTSNRANNNVGAGIDAVGNVDGGGNAGVGNASCNTPGCF